jgi:hypothetical protein
MKTNTMKTLRLLFLLLFIPVSFLNAQKTLTGLWTGKLSNDSLTVRQDQSFEIALTEYRGKVYGYSRATFIVNDTLYYIMKRVKGTIAGDVCEVKDDDIISYNFRGRLDKGVKVTTTFRMNKLDSSWHLDGEWKTNQTKKFYALTGKVELKEEPDMEKSKIFPHLEELKLANDVPFYAEAKKQEQQKQAEKTLATTAPVANKKDKQADMAATKAQQKAQAQEEKKAIKETRKQAEAIASNNPSEEKKIPMTTGTEPKKTDPVVAINKPVEEKKIPVTIGTEEKKTEPVAVNKKPDQPAITVAVVPKENKPTETTIAETKKTVPATISTQPEIKLPIAAALVKERKTAPPQEVNFKSDSLELALYDNGEVDGDTVSVLMNGDIILAKQGLKTSAIRKTIYVKPGTDEITLVLYAENLGKYPPNTGLLVVYDGDDRYQIRFSADLQQNASVIFRRKK